MNMQIYDAYFHLLEIIPFFFYFNLRFLLRQRTRPIKNQKTKVAKYCFYLKTKKKKTQPTNEQLKFRFADKLLNNLSNSIFFFIYPFDLKNQSKSKTVRSHAVLSAAGLVVAVITQEVLNLSPKSAKSEFVRGIFLAVNINHSLQRPFNPGFYIHVASATSPFFCFQITWRSLK